MAEQLESIEVEGFLSIRSASVRLDPLNVLVGANGAGKSNFIRVFVNYSAVWWMENSDFSSA